MQDTGLLFPFLEKERERRMKSDQKARHIREDGKVLLFGICVKNMK
ncbi:hypothetical protein MKC70_13345 [[Clostridium] innocuum]|nr:hypothetical protein [[Clostridium] innocuum]MDU1121823.1 hypothetical protein [Erysipelotrichaceae bacterium]